MSPLWGSFKSVNNKMLIPKLLRWADEADISNYLKNEEFIKLRNSLIPYYFSEAKDGWNINQKERIHVLIENRLAGKNNDASWENHAGLEWLVYQYDDIYQGLYSLHQTLDFSEGSRYLAMYRLAWNDKVDNAYAYPNIAHSNGFNNIERKTFWKRLHRCLHIRPNQFERIRYTQANMKYNTSCLDETQANSHIRKGYNYTKIIITLNDKT